MGSRSHNQGTEPGSEPGLGLGEKAGKSGKNQHPTNSTRASGEQKGGSNLGEQDRFMDFFQPLNSIGLPSQEEHEDDDTHLPSVEFDTQRKVQNERVMDQKRIRPQHKHTVDSTTFSSNGFISNPDEASENDYGRSMDMPTNHELTTALGQIESNPREFIANLKSDANWSDYDNASNSHLSKDESTNFDSNSLNRPPIPPQKAASNKIQDIDPYTSPEAILLSLRSSRDTDNSGTPENNRNHSPNSLVSNNLPSSGTLFDGDTGGAYDRNTSMGNISSYMFNSNTPIGLSLLGSLSW